MSARTSRNAFLSIILVEPENPDNIGSAARAVKNMGFSDLRLVNPPDGWLAGAKKMSMSAYDVARRARVFSSLKEAVADLKMTVATTRRYGPKRGMFLPFEEALDKIRGLVPKSSVGIVFGKESKGLDNASLRLCDWVTTIPAYSKYPSLNLSQAVLILCYEISKKFSRGKTLNATEMEFVPNEEVLEVLGRFRKALLTLGYEETGTTTIVDRITATFHRLLKRGGLLACEAQMLRGLSRRICQTTDLIAKKG